MQKRKQKNTIKKIIILTILAILLLLLIFAEDIIKLTKDNKTALLENTPNKTTIIEPNIPVLSAGMIPIKWESNHFVITTVEDNDWYDYKSGKPAYIMLNDGYYQSELIIDMTNKELAENSVGNDALVVPDVPDNNPTILMWIPRLAVNNEISDIQYIRNVETAEEGWTIPEMFTYKQETETSPDFLLTGIWLEKDVDTNFANKITQMNQEESTYGFIKNTIAVFSDQTTQNTIQTYIANVVGADDPVCPQITDSTNPNRIILKIINQNNQEPIKAKASYNKETELITVEVTYSQYGVEKILYEDTQELKLTQNGNKATATSEGINVEYGIRKITIIDKQGNTKELEVGITSKVYVTLYTDGTLGFCSNNTKIAGKTVSQDYGDISDKEFTSSSARPWYNKITDITTVEFVDKIAPASTAWWLYWCKNLTTINNIENLNTSNVTNMSWMFGWCISLTSLDLSSFDTSNVTNMSLMFYKCENLTSLDVSNFNTAKVTNMEEMFQECISLTSLDLSNFDTSNVILIDCMFYKCASLIELDVSNFDTSNATDIYVMFQGCSSLEKLDVSNFKFNKVTNISSMFRDCTNLTELNLSGLDTSNIERMAYTFQGCTSLKKLDLSSFDTSNVINIQDIFKDCGSLTQITFGEKWNKEITLPILTKPCTGWYSDLDFTNKVAEAGANYTPTGPITIYANVPPDIFVKLYTDGTLAFCSNNSQIPFKELSKDYGNIGGKEYTIANSNYQPWYDRNNSPVKTVQFVDKISPVSTSCWFHCCTNLTTINNIENLDTKNVTSMNFMFNYCENLTQLDLSNFNTSKVTDMRGLIRNCATLTSIDLSSFNTSKVTDMTNMFDQCSSLTSLDLSNFDTSNVVDMTDMFTSCTNLTQLDLSNFNTSSVTDMASMFSYCTNLKSIDLSSFNTNNVTNISGMFDRCTNLTSLDLSSFDTNKVTSTSYIFSQCTNLIQITFGEKWNKSLPLPVPRKTCTGWYSDADFTTKVADAGASYNPNGAITIYTDVVPDIYVTLYTDGTLAFAETKNPFPEKTISVQYDDISEESFFAYNSTPWYDQRESITTAEFVDKMSPKSTAGWFFECENLRTINNIENLDTSNTTNMRNMFYGCTNLQQLDTSNFNTSKVTNMECMFYNCSSLTSLNVSNFDTANVTEMASMFNSCSSLKEIDVSNFDTSKVTNMHRMFINCSNLTELNVSNFNTSSVNSSMSEMFSGCTGLISLDLSNFDTSKVTNMYGMFKDCTNLKTIYVGVYWRLASNRTDMFTGCGTSTVTRK